MERLSSCYFCGVAVEAEVREYPTVVGDLEGLELPPEEDRPTVPLCRSCRSKLDRILAGLGTGAPDGGNAVVGTDPTAREVSASDGDSQESGDDSREVAGDPDATGSDHADSGVTDGRSTTASNEETDGSQGIRADAEIFGDTDAVRLDEDPWDDGQSDAAGEQRETESPTGTDTEDGTPGGDGDSADGNDHGSDGEEATRSFTASQAAGGRSTSSHGEATADDEAGGESHDDSGDVESEECDERDRGGLRIETGRQQRDVQERQHDRCPEGDAFQRVGDECLEGPATDIRGSVQGISDGGTRHLGTPLRYLQRRVVRLNNRARLWLVSPVSVP
jgi:hypothetical protein